MPVDFKANGSISNQAEAHFVESKLWYVVGICPAHVKLESIDKFVEFNFVERGMDAVLCTCCNRLKSSESDFAFESHFLFFNNNLRPL